MKKKVAFLTLGCKVNQYETNAMIQKFIENDYEITKFDEKADVYIVNTCTVTNVADRKSRQMLRRAKEINPNSVLVACGCYAQVGKDALAQIPEIDLILGVNEKTKMLEYIQYYFESGERELSISDVMQQKEFLDFGTITYTDKTRAVIKVQDGCDRFCSYCIIPYARGRIRSRKIDSVVEEINKIAQKGIKEVIITGIHVASFGRDFKDGTQLIDLLEAINKVDGIERIRLSSIEPTLMNKDFVDRMSKLEKVCDHFHLSLQSGCDETLKRMNRRYTTQEFYEGTMLLKNAYPNVALTTDVIVGFPGETDKEFNDTYNFLEKIGFYKMHIFKYSIRKGTKAASMPDQVDGKIKEERSKKLIELSNKNEIEKNKKYINQEVEVLFEEKDGQYYKGHTTNYITVFAESNKNNEDVENKILKVRIKDLHELGLIGEIID